MHKPSAKAKCIASLLMCAMGIPDDRSLVAVFGHGKEASNLEAITGWVESHMDEIDAEKTISRLQDMTAQPATNTCRGGIYAEG